MDLRKIEAVVLVLILLCVCSVSARPVDVPGTLVRVYPPEDVLAFSHYEGDRVVLEFPGVRRWVLDVADTSVYPMAIDEVVEAIEAIDFPIDDVPIDVLILPFPRTDVARSSAEGRVVLLSPGRTTYPREHIHYTVTHEIGHVVHRVFMPDSRGDLWQEYVMVRGLEAADLDSDRHSDRLHEIFAEDFRVLFGGPLARNAGRVENHELSSPVEIPELRDFMLSLTRKVEGTLIVYPNPFTSRVALSLEPSSATGVVKIYDVRGRLVSSLKPQGGRVVWDGRTALGQEVAAGLYLAVWIDHDRLRCAKVFKASP